MCRRSKPSSTGPRRPDSSTTRRLPRWGGFVGFDTRDVLRGPRRGGFYGIDFNRFSIWTRARTRIGGWKSRVSSSSRISTNTSRGDVRRARFAYTGHDDRVVPFYLLPQLGGNFELRGFNNYRFSDNNAFRADGRASMVCVQRPRDGRLPRRRQNRSGEGRRRLLEIKLQRRHRIRARVTDAVVLRFDVARSHEGFRWIWSMSDISLRRF